MIRTIHFFDWETSGLPGEDPQHEGIDLAIIRWTPDGQRTVLFDQIFMPLGDVGEFSARRYTPEVLQSKPHWSSHFARQLVPILAEVELWGGSNPAFDRGILDTMMRRVRVPYRLAGHRNVDVASLASPLQLAGLVENTGLHSLMQFFQLGSQSHTALDDAHKAIDVYERLVQLYHGGFHSLLQPR